MDAQSLKEILANQPLGAGLASAALLMVIAIVLRRFGLSALYVITLIGFLLWTAVVGQLPYFFAFLLGLATGFSEIIMRFKDEPVKALCTGAGYFYSLANGALSAGALNLLILFGAPYNTNLEQLNLVIIAGLGSMLVLRSKLFSIKIDDEKIAFGPEQVVNVYFRFLQDSIGRTRARSRISSIRTLMDGLHFDRVRAYTLTMLDSATTLDQNQKIEIIDQIKKISEDEGLEPQLKSYKLGFILMNLMGEEFISEIYRVRDGAWLIKAPAPSQGLTDKIASLVFKGKSFNFFGYGMAVSREVLSGYLGWRGHEADKILPSGSRKAALHGYKLVFNMPYGAQEPQRGNANLEPLAGGKVEGLVYSMPDELIGFIEQHWREMYELITVRVEMLSEKKRGEFVECKTFVAVSPKGGLKPTSPYIKAMVEAYKKAGLSDSYIKEIEAADTLRQPLPS